MNFISTLVGLLHGLWLLSCTGERSPPKARLTPPDVDGNPFYDSQLTALLYGQCSRGLVRDDIQKAPESWESALFRYGTLESNTCLLALFISGYDPREDDFLLKTVAIMDSEEHVICGQSVDVSSGLWRSQLIFENIYLHSDHLIVMFEGVGPDGEMVIYQFDAGGVKEKEEFNGLPVIARSDLSESVDDSRVGFAMLWFSPNITRGVMEGFSKDPKKKARIGELPSVLAHRQLPFRLRVYDIGRQEDVPPSSELHFRTLDGKNLGGDPESFEYFKRETHLILYLKQENGYVRQLVRVS